MKKYRSPFLSKLNFNQKQFSQGSFSNAFPCRNNTASDFLQMAGEYQSTHQYFRLINNISSLNIYWLIRKKILSTPHRFFNMIKIKHSLFHKRDLICKGVFCSRDELYRTSERIYPEGGGHPVGISNSGLASCLLCGRIDHLVLYPFVYEGSKESKRKSSFNHGRRWRSRPRVGSEVGQDQG